MKYELTENVVIRDIDIDDIKVGLLKKANNGQYAVLGDIANLGISLKDTIFCQTVVGLPMYFRLDRSIGKHLLFHQAWEAEFTQYFLRIMNKDEFKNDKHFTFIDAGMHFGYFSFLISRMLPWSTIIGIEPDVENLRIAYLNLFTHRKKILFQCALSDFNGLAPFYFGTVESARGSLYKEELYKDEPMKLDKVEARTIDSLGIDFDKVKAIKIDIQGAEKVVFKDFYRLANPGTHIFIEDSEPVRGLIFQHEFKFKKLVPPNWHLIK